MIPNETYEAAWLVCVKADRALPIETTFFALSLQAHLRELLRDLGETPGETCDFQVITRKRFDNTPEDRRRSRGRQTNFCRKLYELYVFQSCGHAACKAVLCISIGGE